MGRRARPPHLLPRLPAVAVRRDGGRSSSRGGCRAGRRPGGGGGGVRPDFRGADAPPSPRPRPPAGGLLAPRLRAPAGSGAAIRSRPLRGREEWRTTACGWPAPDIPLDVLGKAGTEGHSPQQGAHDAGRTLRAPLPPREARLAARCRRCLRWWQAPAAGAPGGGGRGALGAVGRACAPAGGRQGGRALRGGLGWRPTPGVCAAAAAAGWEEVG